MADLCKSMRSRRSTEPVIADLPSDVSMDTSDDDYKESSSDENFMPETKRFRQANRTTLEVSDIPWFLGTASLRGAPGHLLARLKRTVQDMHPFLQRPDAEFHTEWCDDLKRYFLTEPFAETLRDLEKVPAADSEKETSNATTHETKKVKAPTFAFGVDISRFGGEPEMGTPTVEKDETTTTADIPVDDQMDKKRTTTEAALETWKSLKSANPEMAEELTEHRKSKHAFLDQQQFLSEASDRQHVMRSQMERDSRM